jgi:hypothetical protein
MPLTAAEARRLVRLLRLLRRYLREGIDSCLVGGEVDPLLPDLAPIVKRDRRYLASVDKHIWLLGTYAKARTGL